MLYENSIYHSFHPLILSMRLTIINQMLSTSLHDIYNYIFCSEYYPFYYIFHAIYVCLNIRLTTNSQGLTWYRSLILTYCLSMCHRYLLQLFLPTLTPTELPDFKEMTSFKGFFAVWAAFNIFPFDLIFLIFNRKPILWIVQILDSFTIGRSIVICCEKAAIASQFQFLRVLIIAICTSCSPILVDLFDRFFIQQRKNMMAYEIHYSKRLITGVFFVTFGVILQNDMNGGLFEIPFIIAFYTPIVFALLSCIDLIINKGVIYKTCDFIFPNFWTRYAVFNPNPNNS